MATLVIQGREVEVDDSFRNLSPEQQKTRQWRVLNMLPPRRGFAAPTQQESSAHDGRVSGDSIPI